ncbi:hypothetical protein PFLUV_G00009750 [Perca fluviatilis]|uniref:Uncharacterized protein n=1 Tax=Perca fluviatilis TaxID=8168 RepID=A0A6A5FHZ6_PERFL|nr:hypothetical protein PFLUV_G00009750 [Perca fluviatilis]
MHEVTAVLHTYILLLYCYSEVMQLLCIAALLLSAVAAKPDSWRPWQNGPKLDADSKHGDDEQSLTPAPEDGDGGSGVIDWPLGHRGPSKGKRPNRRNPGAMAFSPMIKVDNVTFQNTTAVPLKEGENIFLMPKNGGGGPHHNKGGRNGPPKDGQYVKLIYNASEPNKVSIEFGVLKPMHLGEFVGEEDNPEEDY